MSALALFWIWQQTKPRGALKSLFNFNFKCASFFFVIGPCVAHSKQSAGQINKIKWQTHYKASGEWTPSGNVTATSRQRDPRRCTPPTMQLAAQQKKKEKNRAKNGQQSAAQKAQWWLNTRCRLVLPHLPQMLPVAVVAAAAAAVAARLAALFGGSGQAPAAMAATPPWGH